MKPCLWKTVVMRIALPPHHSWHIMPMLYLYILPTSLQMEAAHPQ